MPSFVHTDFSAGSTFDDVEADKLGVGIETLAVFVDRFNQTSMAAAANAYGLFFDITTGLWVARQQLSTDNPGVVRNSVSATTYAFQGTDQGKLKHFTAATAVTATFPTGLSTIADATGTWRQYGAGQITWVSGGAGNSAVSSRGGALKSAGQYAEGTWTRVGTTDEYILSGDLTV